jgi:hypothetical protein
MSTYSRKITVRLYHFKNLKHEIVLYALNEMEALKKVLSDLKLESWLDEPSYKIEISIN